MTKVEIQKEIESIKRQLIDNYGAEKIILFGSAAQGRFDEDSDLDFLIIKKDSPYYGKDRLLELDHLIEYNLPVDMLVYRPEEFDERLKMGDPFIKSIVAKGKVLYG